MSLVEAKRRQWAPDPRLPRWIAFTVAIELRVGGAAERHMMVAVGFSPRSAAAEPRRVATLDIAGARPINRSSVATRRLPICRPNRGLKPTATIGSSLCDEKPQILA